MDSIIFDGVKAKWVRGYENVYLITETGRLFRYLKTKAYPKELALSVDTYGYKVCRLSYNYVTRYVAVHRLVAEAFLPNDENLATVDHIDEDKQNNHVSNLRWCSAADNVKYYIQNNAADYRTKLHKDRSDKLKKLELLLKLKTAEISKLEKELKNRTEQLSKAETALAKLIEIESQRLTQPYCGYLDISGSKFVSVDEMVNVVGKPITVNGIAFNSCGSAATYIVAEELKLGIIRKHGTISKELRRYLQGKRNSWSMYNRYTIA